MNRESIESEARFQACVDVLASVIGHAECNGPLQDYCTGLLLPVERKSVEPMSAMTAIAVLGCCVLTGLSELAKNFPKSSLPGWFRLKQYLVQKNWGRSPARMDQWRRKHAHQRRRGEQLLHRYRKTNTYQKSSSGIFQKPFSA